MEAKWGRNEGIRAKESLPFTTWDCLQHEGAIIRLRWNEELPNHLSALFHMATYPYQVTMLVPCDNVRSVP